MRDVSRYAGRQHDLFLYLCAPGATGQVWAYTGGAERNANAAPIALHLPTAALNN
jgi:hypothetical protein